MGEKEARVSAVKKLQEDLKLLRKKMESIKHKVLIMSGKGGVGKSVLAANLAAIFSKKGYEVGILDADIHGPSIPKILGAHGKRLQLGPLGRIFPVKSSAGVRIFSMDFLLEESQPVIWRGPMKAVAIRQFLLDIVWGSLDILLVDLPPGTGDEPLSIIQLLPDLDGTIIVTIPSVVSEMIVGKAVSFARELRIPIIGIIENMSGFICPKCGERINLFGEGGGERIAEKFSIPFLGRIPIDPRISSSSDKGKPFIEEYPNSEASKELFEIAEKIRKFLEKRS